MLLLLFVCVKEAHENLTSQSQCSALHAHTFYLVPFNLLVDCFLILCNAISGVWILFVNVYTSNSAVKALFFIALHFYLCVCFYLFVHSFIFLTHSWRVHISNPFRASVLLLSLLWYAHYDNFIVLIGNFRFSKLKVTNYQKKTYKFK